MIRLGLATGILIQVAAASFLSDGADAALGATPKQRLSSKTLDTWSQKLEEVQKELKNEPREIWEGSFYINSGFRGLSRDWLISRKLGYVSTSRLQDYGKVEVAGDKLILISDFPLAVGGRKTHEYTVVRWGPRVYLVEPDLMLAFCNDVNSQSLYSAGAPRALYVLRSDDYEKKLTGLPSVPREYQEYLLQAPIRGMLTKHDRVKNEVAIAGEKALHAGWVVTLSVGFKAGVRTGMKFFPEGMPLEKRCRAFVISTDLAESELLLDGVVAQGIQDYPVRTVFATVDELYTKHVSDR